jgi:hypothetical protein
MVLKLNLNNLKFEMATRSVQSAEVKKEKLLDIQKRE